jgi:hypothetical protein
MCAVFSVFVLSSVGRGPSLGRFGDLRNVWKIHKEIMNWRRSKEILEKENTLWQRQGAHFSEISVHYSHYYMTSKRDDNYYKLHIARFRNLNPCLVVLFLEAAPGISKKAGDMHLLYFSNLQILHNIPCVRESWRNSNFFCNSTKSLKEPSWNLGCELKQASTYLSSFQLSEYFGL